MKTRWWMDGYESSMDGNDKFISEYVFVNFSWSPGFTTSAVFLGGVWQIFMANLSTQATFSEVSTASNDRQEFDGRWMPLVFLRGFHRRAMPGEDWCSTEKSLAIKTSI